MIANTVFHGEAIVHVIWRICENHIGDFVLHQLFNVIYHGGIATYQTVSAQLPNIATLCDSFLGCFRNFIIIGVTGRLFLAEQLDFV